MRTGGFNCLRKCLCNELTLLTGVSLASTNVVDRSAVEEVVGRGTGYRSSLVVERKLRWLAEPHNYPF
jgi:hypothetical protein